MQLNQIKLKFTKANRKKIKPAAAIAVVGLILTAVIFYYLPRSRELARIKNKADYLESQVKEIEENISAGPLDGKKIKLLRQELARLEDKFPSQERGSLKKLSDLTKKFKINLVSVRPQAKQVFKDESGRPVIIDGKVCFRLFVSYQLEACFFDLIDYLQALRKELPAAVTVEFLDMRKTRAFPKILEVDLGVNIFLLSQE